eukprot:3662128-Prymnesium_polylepis.1
MRSASGAEGARGDAPFILRLFSANPLAHKSLPSSDHDVVVLRNALHASLAQVDTSHKGPQPSPLGFQLSIRTAWTEGGYGGGGVRLAIAEGCGAAL